MNRGHSKAYPMVHLKLQIENPQTKTYEQHSCDEMSCYKHHLSHVTRSCVLHAQVPI